MTYTKGGRTYDKGIGTRLEVVRGHAHHTSGGLTASDFTKNKSGKWVSKSRSAAGKRVGLRNLGAHVFKKGGSR